MAVGSSMAQLVVASCLGLSGVLAQVSFDTEGEFDANHFRQTRCADFVARCLTLSFAELDVDALMSAQWADSGQGRWPNGSLGASAVVPLSTSSPSEQRCLSFDRGQQTSSGQGVSRRIGRLASPRVLVYRPRHLVQHHSRQ